MSEFVIYKGEKYYLQSTGRYYQNGRKNVKNRSLHRQIWIDNFGEIPTGYVIHHKDHNWKNNDISNLELIERRQHYINHANDNFKNEEYKIKNKEKLLESSQLAKAWHSSKEGLEWHSKHAKQGWNARKLYEIICKTCGEKKLTPFPERTVFCKLSCYRKFEYQKNKTSKRSCLICKKEFICNYHKTIKTCSRSCGAKMRWNK
jgi:hypothetical protein